MMNNVLTVTIEETSTLREAPIKEEIEIFDNDIPSCSSDEACSLKEKFLDSYINKGLKIYIDRYMVGGMYELMPSIQIRNYSFYISLFSFRLVIRRKHNWEK